MNLFIALLNSRLRAPRSLSPDELRELWDLRKSQLTLKPEWSPEDDFSKFCADYQHDGLVWILRQRGEVVGTYLQRVALAEHEGQRLVVLAPDYVFTQPHLRKNPILLLAVIALTVLPVCKHPLRRPIATGAVYPAAYIAWRRLVQPCWSLGDPDLTEAQAGLVSALAELIWEDAYNGDGSVAFRTLPDPTTPKSRTGRAILAAYEAMNPNWKSGNAIFFVTPLGPKTVVGGIWNSASAAIGPRRRPTQQTSQ